MLGLGSGSAALIRISALQIFRSGNPSDRSQRAVVRLIALIARVPADVALTPLSMVLAIVMLFTCGSGAEPAVRAPQASAAIDAGKAAVVLSPRQVCDLRRDPLNEHAVCIMSRRYLARLGGRQSNTCENRRLCCRLEEGRVALCYRLRREHAQLLRWPTSDTKTAGDRFDITTEHLADKCRIALGISGG